VSRAQASPGWIQNEEPSAQVPFEQSPEQQPPAPPSVALQGLPAVLHVALSAWQVPPLQLPPQHWLELVQLAPSATQAPLAQTPRVVSHCRLQQSVATAHELPTPLQVVTEDLHVPETGSQACEQHCWSPVQALPVTVQMTLVPPPPPVPVVITLAFPPPHPASPTAAAAIASVI